jgi:hypothetical protein
MTDGNWIDTRGVPDDGASERECPSCGQTYDRDQGHAFDAIKEFGKCPECLGCCPYCKGTC